MALFPNGKEEVWATVAAGGTETGWRETPWEGLGALSILAEQEPGPSPEMVLALWWVHAAQTPQPSRKGWWLLPDTPALQLLSA